MSLKWLDPPKRTINEVRVKVDYQRLNLDDWKIRSLNNSSSSDDNFHESIFKSVMCAYRNDHTSTSSTLEREARRLRETLVDFLRENEEKRFPGCEKSLKELVLSVSKIDNYSTFLKKLMDNSNDLREVKFYLLSMRYRARIYVYEYVTFGFAKSLKIFRLYKIYTNEVTSILNQPICVFEEGGYYGGKHYPGYNVFLYKSELKANKLVENKVKQKMKPIEVAKTTLHPIFNDDALFTDDARLIKVKLKLGANPNYIKQDNNYAQQTPLLFAIDSNFKNIVKITKRFLKVDGIDINQRDTNGNTALLLASQKLKEKVCFDILSLLIKHPNIDVNLANKANETCLFILIERKLFEEVQLIVENTNCDVNSIRSIGSLITTPLLWFVDQCDSQFVALLLNCPQTDINLSLAKVTPLELAQRKYLTSRYTEEKQELMNIILKLSYDKRLLPNVVGRDNMTSLLRSIEYESDTVMEALLKNPKIDVNSRTPLGKTALYLAVEYNSCTKVECLFEHESIDPNIQLKNGDICLHKAVESMNLNMIELLLKYPKINPNMKNRQDISPLYQAVETGNEDIIKMFLACPSIDPNVYSKGETALHRAHHLGYKNILMEIIKHSDTNAALQNSNGKSIIALTRDMDILSLLVDDDDDTD